jgi:NAD(P)-dependent dehydrogenase (short-subunit alcohol dehydrogenase family)
VVNGIHAFVPAMIESGRAGLVVNTGSKQGITQPPGNTAYNVSKAGVKALTEGLAHTLREKTGDRVTASSARTSRGSRQLASHEAVKGGARHIPTWQTSRHLDPSSPALTHVAGW